MRFGREKFIHKKVVKNNEINDGQSARAAHTNGICVSDCNGYPFVTKEQKIKVKSAGRQATPKKTTF